MSPYGKSYRYIHWSFHSNADSNLFGNARSACCNRRKSRSAAAMRLIGIWLPVDVKHRQFHKPWFGEHSISGHNHLQFHKAIVKIANVGQKLQPNYPPWPFAQSTATFIASQNQVAACIDGSVNLPEPLIIVTFMINHYYENHIDHNYLGKKHCKD